ALPGCRLRRRAEPESGAVRGGRRYPTHGLVQHPSGGVGQERAHECALISQNTAALVPDAVRLDELGVLAEKGPVLLIHRETGETEQSQRLVACTLAR